ncbi:CRISPR-associated protein Cas4 [Alkaliphilus peptidifermentans]|uniref:CRISPR-associated exonuclease Cas4 n=1 Tax=Alkaliphilus peptidifermentans DSM 18978 TaxID=1120976 RepID=A0A1G5ITJ9_9FIRM|nr:CRISPR-associated protein Cas4 [Alkaliphilus peptidifermentans]SCY79415.1 CRISPR-associated exonuclease, Cas4 family [Alkaliphilus peptidifermentans DSM 18978]
MKSSLNSFNEHQYYITPSEIIEFLYCKRFIYFMKCLGIQQYEEKRYKVQKGRNIHEKREKENRDYLRKRLNVIDKDIDVSLVSNKYKIRGKVDEVLTLVDGTMAPLDYKFAVYDDIIYSTYYTQIVMYGLMIEEVYDKLVSKGYVVYCRDGYTVKEVDITDNEKENMKKTISDYTKVIEGYFPKATRYKARCIDCCYKNICIK